MLNARTQQPLRKKKLKPKKPSAASTKLPSTRSGWPSFFVSFFLKVLTCYLALSYFYWCPRDPTQNPFVCRNLAELHWALEPHVSPYLAQLNQHVRTPLQLRVDRKLRPLYDNYLLPTWTQVSPQASKALDFLKDSIQRSGAIEWVGNLRTLYLNPVVEHVTKQYEEKLQPHVQLASTSSKQAFQVVRKSRLIKALKSYLPHVRRFIVQYLIRPIQHQVVPALNRYHSQYVQPAIRRCADSLYQHLFINDNSLKNHLRTIKLTYRRRLLRPLKNLNEIYVRPQIKKIVLKLDEYQNRNNESIQVDRPSSPVTPPQNSDHPIVNDEPPSNSNENVEKPLRSTNELTSPSPVAEQLTQSPQEPVADPVISPVESNNSIPSSDTLDDVETEYTIQTENESTRELDIQPDLVIDHESSQTDFDVEESVETESELDRKNAELYDDSSDAEELDSTDSLTVDADEFMEEINNEIASESEAPTPVPETNRKSPEKIAEERRRLKKLAEDGFKRLEELKKETMKEFIKGLKKKRNSENLRKHKEFMEKERINIIKKESEKLIERLTKWFTRNEKSETKKNDEKISEAELVLKKSKDKFLIKLIKPLLNEIDQYRRKEMENEQEILDIQAAPAAEYAAQIQSELGFGFTWLSDVSYHDWAIYHKFRSEADSIKPTMQELIEKGTLIKNKHNQGDSSLDDDVPPKLDFFVVIDQLLLDIHAAHDHFVHRLHTLFLNHRNLLLNQNNNIPPLENQNDNNPPIHRVDL